MVTGNNVKVSATDIASKCLATGGNITLKAFKVLQHITKVSVTRNITILGSCLKVTWKLLNIKLSPSRSLAKVKNTRRRPSRLLATGNEITLWPLNGVHSKNEN